MRLKHCFKKSLLWGILLPLVALSWFSCRTDFDFDVSEGNLRFSKDTVFLDTIFANISSSTYSLKVYNDSDSDIQIPRIQLRENESRYRLNVDGLAGRSFENIPLLANDSLFVFIETVVPDNSFETLEFLHTDALQFIGSQSTQEIPLITLVKDAFFLYPEELADGISETLLLGLDSEGDEVRIDGFFLEDEELVFTNEKPYVIYGYAAVPEGKTLTVEAGARVHFHKNSGLLITENASLNVNGELSTDQELLENEVIFEGDRLEPEFADVGGQWGTIWFLPGSTGNLLSNLTIRNATIGLFCEGQEDSENVAFTLSNVQVYNSSSVNLWTRTAWLSAENCVFGNAGEASVYCNLGGTYDFKHCTLANYWTATFRIAPTLLLDNFLEVDESFTLSSDLNQAFFGNCIIDGNRPIEFLGFANATNLFDFRFQNCLLQFDTTDTLLLQNPIYDFEDGTRYASLGLNLDPAFAEPSDNNFNLTQESAALNFGDEGIAAEVPFDILGNVRNSRFDVGAYLFIPEN